MPPARAKRPTSSSALALRDVAQACALFEPRDGQTSNDLALEARKQVIDREIAAIIKKYGLSCSEAELLSVVSTAADELWAWRYVSREQMEGLGDKSAVASLVSTLTRASALLNDVKIRNRLAKAIDAAAKEDLPTNDRQGIAYQFGKCVFDSIPHSRAQISGLLAIAKRAEELDGRDDVAKRRDDLRAAAQPLRTYWTQYEMRSGALSNWGSLAAATGPRRSSPVTVMR
jgi:hypothetical protein